VTPAPDPRVYLGSVTLALLLLACMTKTTPDIGDTGASGGCVPGEEVPYDGIDGDCDGADDYDVDGDGYVPDEYAGLPTEGVEGSGSLPGGDCDDSNADAHPDGTEVCNGVDDDCNGAVDDDATDAPAWVIDADGDGFAGDTEVRACDPPADFTATGGDCDDAAPDVFPGADELCNDVDDDCDGDVDEDPVDGTTWIIDPDGDGYGADGATTVVSCAEPGDTWTTVAGDCDGADPSVHPGASESCNDIDDDCDGDIDEDGEVIDGLTWVTDNDRDGYGSVDGTEVVACSAPESTGWALATGDCDDRHSAVNPGATEVCNGIDDDCDDVIDTDAVDLVSAWEDADGDGFGVDGSETLVCERSSTQADQGGDCNDKVATINPDATEICNGVDDDCDDTIDVGAADASWVYEDLDGDGFGDDASYDQLCTVESWHVDVGGDCDDDDFDVNPDATEVCNGIDDNCDDVVDTDAVDLVDAWEDLDGDGFGDPASYSQVCDRSATQVDDDTDCDDTNPDVNPAAIEVCNGLDDDCDDLVDPVFYSSDLAADPSADLQINGDADWRDSMVRLTDKKDDEFGSAFLVDAIPGDRWLVSFQAKIWDQDSTGADGMTFAFLDESVADTWVTTGSGQYLGVGGATGWAVELDTYDNGDAAGDPDSEHVSLMRTDDWTALATEADPPNLDGGDWYLVEVLYDAATVQAWVGGTLVIDSTIDGSIPEWWRLGWTAATGGSHERHGVDDLWVGCPE